MCASFLFLFLIPKNVCFSFVDTLTNSLRTSLFLANSFYSHFALSFLSGLSFSFLVCFEYYFFSLFLLFYLFLKFFLFIFHYRSPASFQFLFLLPRVHCNVEHCIAIKNALRILTRIWFYWFFCLVFYYDYYYYLFILWNNVVFS